MGEGERETTSSEALNNVLIKRNKAALYIVVNRPSKMNNLSIETLRELIRIFERLINDNEIKVVVITGSGDKSFISGADISELAHLSHFDALWFSDLGHHLFNLIERVHKIVIAAINGYCMGGGFDLAMACDVRVAKKSAVFAHTASKMGIITGFGGTQRLVRLVGLRRAKEIFFTARSYTAYEMYKMGVLYKVFEDEDFYRDLDLMVDGMQHFDMRKISVVKDILRGAVGLYDDSYRLYEFAIMNAR